MTQRAPGRKSALIALTAVALLALGVMAPVASAQVPGVVDNAVGGATGAVDQVGAGAGGAAESVGGTVDTVTGGGSDDGGSTGGGGGGTVGGVVGTVGGVVDNTVDKTTDAGNTIYEGTKKTVENTTSETGTAVNGVVNGVVNGAGDLGGGLTNPLLNVKDPRNRDRDGDGKISKGERNLGGTRADNRKAAMRSEIAADRAARKSAEQGKAAALANAEKNRNPVSGISSVIEPPQRETFITQLAQAAGEAAEKLAFPLGLALMVGAFLMVQGRIDRKDAKLVLAPIDSEQDLLSFQ